VVLNLQYPRINAAGAYSTEQGFSFLQSHLDYSEYASSFLQENFYLVLAADTSDCNHSVKSGKLVDSVEQLKAVISGDVKGRQISNTVFTYLWGVVSVEEQ
jgi:hypothetical protein